MDKTLWVRMNLGDTGAVDLAQRPPREAFRQFQKRHGKSGNTKRWQAFWEGCPVPATFARDVLAYLSHLAALESITAQQTSLKTVKPRLVLDFDADFKECEAPIRARRTDIESEVLAAVPARESDWYLAKAGSIAAFLARPALPKRFFKTEFPAECFCQDQADIEQLAYMVVRCAGLHTGGEQLTDAEAIEQGENLMNRSVEEYAEWLWGLHQVDCRIAMFAPSVQLKT